MNSGKIVACDTVSHLKNSYAGLKTIEVSVSGEPDKTGILFSTIRSGNVEAPSEPDSPYRVVTSNTQETMQEIVSSAISLGLVINWLNVRSVYL